MSDNLLTGTAQIHTKKSHR